MKMKNWLTIKDAALYLGTSTKFIRALIEDGLPMYKVRKLIFVKKEEVDDLIAKNKI